MELHTIVLLVRPISLYRVQVWLSNCLSHLSVTWFSSSFMKLVDCLTPYSEAFLFRMKAA